LTDDFWYLLNGKIIKDNEKLVKGDNWLRYFDKLYGEGRGKNQSRRNVNCSKGETNVRNKPKVDNRDLKIDSKFDSWEIYKTPEQKEGIVKRLINEILLEEETYDEEWAEKTSIRLTGKTLKEIRKRSSNIVKKPEKVDAIPDKPMISIPVKPLRTEKDEYLEMMLHGPKIDDDNEMLKRRYEEGDPSQVCSLKIKV
jgi:hypothetical protein